MDLTNSKQELYFQQYMPGDICFGCGEENPAGLQIKSYWQDEDCICLFQPKPQHQGWPDLVCGGIIATLIDCHCMASAMATAIKNENRALGSEPLYRFATGSMTIKYLKPTPSQTELKLLARVIDIKNNRKYTLSCELIANNEKTVEAEVIAFLVYQSQETISNNLAFAKKDQTA